MVSLKPSQLPLCQYCQLSLPTLLKTTSENLARMDVEHIPNNHLCPRMIKRPSATIVHKDPQSYQPCKTDHVENGEEGQSVPSQKLKKGHVHQREDLYHQ